MKGLGLWLVGCPSVNVLNFFLFPIFSSLFSSYFSISSLLSLLQAEDKWVIFGFTEIWTSTWAFFALNLLWAVYEASIHITHFSLLKPFGSRDYESPSTRRRRGEKLRCGAWWNLLLAWWHLSIPVVFPRRVQASIERQLNSDIRTTD